MLAGLLAALAELAPLRTATLSFRGVLWFLSMVGLIIPRGNFITPASPHIATLNLCIFKVARRLGRRPS